MKIREEFVSPRTILGSSSIIRKVDSGSCYHCKFLKNNMSYWICGKHDINFGTANLKGNEHSIANTAEFVCSDFEVY